MNGDPQKMAANLEFFQAAILHPSIEQRRQAHISNADGGMSSFGPVEAAHWASLGAQIGYLDAKDAHAMVASATEVSGSWSELQAYGLAAPHETWAEIFDSRGDLPQVNKGLFEPYAEIAPAATDLLRSTYQSFLLLTAQGNFDEDTYYFLASIGIANKGEWDVRRKGLRPDQAGSSQKIVTGFGKVWSYWDGMHSLSGSLNARSKNEYPVPFAAGSIDLPPHLELSERDMAAISRFTEQARQILSRRYNLENAEIVDRYFAIAGELVHTAREDTSQWLDARAQAFNKLVELMTYAGGEKNINDNLDHLWQLYTESDWRPLREKPAWSPTVRFWDYEPPEKA